MKLVAAKCTQCGADINVDASLLKGCCPFCHTEFLVEQVVNNYIANTGEDTNNLVKAGEARLLLGDFDVAAQKFEKLCDLYPQDYRGWLGLIKAKTKNFTEVFSTQNQLEEILVFYQKAKIVSSDNLDKTFVDVFERYVSDVRKRFLNDISYLNAQIDSINIERKARKLQFENQIEVIKNKILGVTVIRNTILIILMIIWVCVFISAIITVEIVGLIMIGMCVICAVLFVCEICKRKVNDLRMQISMIYNSLNSIDTQYNIRINYLEQQIFAKSSRTL